MKNLILHGLDKNEGDEDFETKVVRLIKSKFLYSGFSIYRSCGRYETHRPKSQRKNKNNLFEADCLGN